MFKEDSEGQVNDLKDSYGNHLLYLQCHRMTLLS